MNTGSTDFHVCIDIAGAMKRTNKALDGVLAGEGGREMSGREVKAFLSKVRTEHGYTKYSGCSNMKADGSCGGHPSEAI
jgi:hypothetical protein